MAGQAGRPRMEQAVTAGGASRWRRTGISPGPGVPLRNPPSRSVPPGLVAGQRIQVPCGAVREAGSLT